MKYIILVADGMADLPIKELDDRTPMSVADKPMMNYLAQHGTVGRIFTVPRDMVPESDTANLALMGYDPHEYSKGRSPLEAASIGIAMQPDETAIRANIVALSDNSEAYEDKIMLDHSSDEIPTSEAAVLVQDLQKHFGNDTIHLYTGVSYRHCLIWKNCPEFKDYSRPHDIIGKRIGQYLPLSASSKPMRDLQKASFDFLNNHPVNIDRAKRGLKKANSLWLWSPGKKPALPDFASLNGLKATVVCAVDLIKGIGICAGMDAPTIEGATGTLNTNYQGKLQAALDAIDNGSDFVFIHVEAPDECGHRGETQNKIKSIENIDKLILAPLKNTLDARGIDYRIVVTPDHPTPICKRTHTLDAVPFVLYDSTQEVDSGIKIYDEQSGFDGKVYLDKGEDLLPMLLGKTI